MSTTEKAKSFVGRFSKLELAQLIISAILVVSVFLPFGYISPKEGMDVRVYPVEVQAQLQSAETVGLFKFLTNEVFTLALMSWMTVITVLLIVIFSLMQRGRFPLYVAALFEFLLVSLLFYDVGVVSAFVFFKMPVPYDFSLSVGSILGMVAAAAGGVIQMVLTRKKTDKKKSRPESDMPAMPQ